MPGKAMHKRVTSEEHVHVDLTSPLSAMIFPVLELIIITGLCWIGIGFLDQLPGWDGTSPADDFPPNSRDVMLGLWALLSTWRFALPLMRQRRYRITITDRRLLVRPSGLGSRYDSIPLSYVHHVHRRRGTLVLGVGGQERPYVINQVPKAKKVESILKNLQRR